MTTAADYTINIPSYKRADTIADRTLATLERNAIERERVTVWVADEEEYDIYRATLDSSWRIDVAAPGLVPARCHINSSYPTGTPILSLDDDVADILVADGKRLTPLPGRLDRFIVDAFETAEREGVRIWGINAAANPMYLKNRYTIGLRYVIGAFFGSYAGDSIWNLDNRTGLSSGEDFETTLHAFARDGGLLRYDGVTIKTAYFAEGGIDAELAGQGIENRQDDHRDRLTEIAGRFPGLAKTYVKAGGVTNIRLNPITAHQVAIDPSRWA